MNTARKIEHDVEGNKSTIDAFTNKMQIQRGHALRGHVRDDGELTGDDRLRRPAAQGARLHRHPVGDRQRERRHHRELVG